MPYKHNELKDIKKNPQRTIPKCYAHQHIIWRLLLCRQSFRNKTRAKKGIEKQNTPGNKRPVNNLSFFR